MSRGLGQVQQKILLGLREQRPHSAPLWSLAYYVEGKLELLEDDWPREPPAPIVYKAVCRAVATLEKRGLVRTRLSYYWHGYNRWEHVPPEKMWTYRDKRGYRVWRKPGHPQRSKMVELVTEDEPAATV